MCGFFKRNCLGLQNFLPLTQSSLVFAARSCGDLPSWHWNPGLGGLLWGWGSSLPRSASWIFIHHMWVWGQPVPCLHPPTSLDGYVFFNSEVVRFPFDLISDGSEWWLLYILVVILMWLWEKVSHVCLHCHFLLLFQYSCLYFHRTAPPKSHPSPLSTLKPNPLVLAYVSFIQVPWWPLSYYPSTPSSLVTVSLLFISRLEVYLL